ncbi:hypothetical protein [Pyrobaculum neutrophilum]|uniref:Uncharacterized protein n=1 Tax=Pyrobaculum neutrophilum (strain DSM 2338 / JCM 9278 / NBRC 100436 / V24Sta) TaxID=444157 RepID=B1YBD1_PYRNV|nr:hypothetical protein [Pyrobaculum neutrophilum]ACB39262.1 conserved hypothetical protein [Pyrobaculum neutrophilum V24Sta]
MRLLAVGLALVFAGFTLLLLAPLLSMGWPSRVEAAGAACVVLFFVPFCFGTGPPEVLAVAVVASVALAAGAALFMWLTAREVARRGEGQGG